MTTSRPVFKQLNHVVARVDEPGRLFSLLTEILGLPVAWPPASYPSFRSVFVALVLKVSSHERAETRLRESGMLGTFTDEEITINPEKLEGLRVRLVNRR